MNSRDAEVIRRAYEHLAPRYGLAEAADAMREVAIAMAAVDHETQKAVEATAKARKIQDLSYTRQAIGQIIDDRGLHGVPKQAYVQRYEELSKEIAELEKEQGHE